MYVLYIYYIYTIYILYIYYIYTIYILYINTIYIYYIYIYIYILYIYTIYIYYIYTIYILYIYTIYIYTIYILYIYTIYIIQSNCFTMFHLSSLFASSRAETVIIKSYGANEVRDGKPSSKPSGKPSLQRQQSRLNLLSLSDVEPLAACPGTRHCGELSKTKCQEPSSTVCKSTKTVMTCICHFVDMVSSLCFGFFEIKQHTKQLINPQPEKFPAAERPRFLNPR